jgi:cytoskeletal protein RodZ
MEWLVIGFMVTGAIGFISMPGYFAFKKKHPYKWIILILGVASPFFIGITWLIAMVWAVWPSDKTAIDAIVNSSDESKNVGAALGKVAASYRTANTKDSSDSAVNSDDQTIEKLEKLAGLLEKGFITEEEFSSQKSRLLGG